MTYIYTSKPFVGYIILIWLYTRLYLLINNLNVTSFFYFYINNNKFNLSSCKSCLLSVCNSCLNRERLMGWIKILLISEWSCQKRKGYHRVSVNRVSCRERRLRKRGNMLRFLCPTWVKFNLNHVYINSWLPSL